MHVLPASMIGIAIWFATMLFVGDMMAVICGPLIVSGVTFVLALVPDR